MACSPKVFITKSEDYGFKNVKSYAWKPHVVAHKHKDYDNVLITENVQNQINKAIGKRLKSVPSVSNADVTLDYVLEIQQKYRTEIETYVSPQTYIPPGSMFFNRAFGPTVYQGRTTTVKAFFEGSIEILIFDTQNKLIWRGITFSNVNNPKIYTDKLLKKDTDKILKKMPFKM